MLTMAAVYDTQREMEERGERMKDMHEIDNFPKEYWIDTLPNVPKDESEDRDECEYRPVYIFMRWNGRSVGRDHFGEFVEVLRGMGVSVERVEDTKMLAIKGRGVIGMVNASTSGWYTLHPDTINWLIEKCKKEEGVDVHISDIIMKAGGEYVTCKTIEEYSKGEREIYYVTMAAILDVTNTDALLYKVLLKYLGQPNLIRPY